MSISFGAVVFGIYLALLAVPIEDVILGIYIGLLAGAFPAFVAFLFGFGFKYFTDVSVPGLGVVVLCGAIAGISGGLMGIMDPAVAESWAGITAIVVILMACLWGHGVGDRLGARTPRRLTLRSLRKSKLTADLVERVDNYGQVRVRPIGDVADIEGYPPLPQELHERIRSRSWQLPADLPLDELEDRLEQELLDEFDLAEVAVSVDRRGRAQIAAAPQAGVLSRRIPEGKQAVSIHTLLPSGLARQEDVSIHLPDGDIRGPVMSARSNNPEDRTTAPIEGADGSTKSGEGEDGPPPAARAPTADGGEGRVTIAVDRDDIELALRYDFAPLTVHARGVQREYEAIAVLNREGNEFRKVTVTDDSDLAGNTLEDLGLRGAYGVLVLSVRRGIEQRILPDTQAELHVGDELIVVGPRRGMRQFMEAST